jgi:hypothetical protein
VRPFRGSAQNTNFAVSRIRDIMAAAAVGAGKLGAGVDAVAVEVRLPPLSEADPLLAEKKVQCSR